MIWETLNQETERGDHGESDYAGGGEGEKSGDVVMAAMSRENDRDEQDDDDHEQSPTGAEGEAFGQRALDERGGEHGDECGPAGFAEDFDIFGHSVGLGGDANNRGAGASKRQRYRIRIGGRYGSRR